ncbi:uncharacterized protein ARMOST_04268 [Armillaria ostoyae]|uniref:Uncharacterized protein n=1 Tax=Armillaria ostoyae TaxID=47428 RepID=A0A284QWX4_ARMOS|nr:uncharacterized protein ARMOST_04268 [Armillaria ostoyae]
MLPPFLSPLYQDPFLTAQDTEFLRNPLGQPPIRWSTRPTIHPLLIRQAIRLAATPYAIRFISSVFDKPRPQELTAINLTSGWWKVYPPGRSTLHPTARRLEAEALRAIALAATGNRITDEEDLFDIVPDNKSRHFHLDSSFTSAYEQELRAILESPLSSLTPSPEASPLAGPSNRPRSSSDPQAYSSDLLEPNLFRTWLDEQEQPSPPPSPTLFPVDKTFRWSRNRRIHFHFNMAAQTQQLPIRGSGKAPSWGWKGPEDSITLPVFFDEVERTCESVGQQTDWQYIQAAILYADPTAADLWRRLSQANPANQATATWDAFKTECYSFYPKSNETR